MMHQIRKVLLPTDFSDVAQNAVHTAVSICTRQRAELVLMHVVEQQYYLMAPEGGIMATESMELYEREAEKKLTELARMLYERFEITVSAVVVIGDPAGQICKWSAVNLVDMIVMGTHGASGLREFFIGSNAYRVVKHSVCPVMTIPGNNRWIEFKRILFPVRLIQDALAKYTVVRPIIHKNGSSLLVAGVIKRGDDQSESEMDKMVKQIEEIMNEDEVAFRTEVHYTDAVAQHVLHISQAERPDLVVITATFDQNDGLKDFFVGPYTQQIVNHCKFPVLSIGRVQDFKRGADGAIPAFS